MFLPEMSAPACQSQHQRGTQYCQLQQPEGVLSLVGTSPVQSLPAPIMISRFRTEYKQDPLHLF